MSRLNELQDRVAKIAADAAAIVDAADKSNRTLTADETEKVKALHAEFSDLDAKLGALEAVSEMRRPAPVAQERIVKAEKPEASTTSARPDYGFKNMAEYLSAVRSASLGRLDPRLVSNAVTTLGGENFGADGGFAIPPDFRPGIQQAWESDENISRLFTPIITGSNIVTLVTDETTPHQTSGGILGGWLDEGGTSSPTKPLIKQVNVVLRKVAALVHLSEEVMYDAPVLQSYVSAKMGQKLSSLVSDAIVNGDGNGKPQGILNSPAKVQVTRGTASTVKAADVSGMVSRLRPGSFGKAFWLAHTSVLPQLWTMTIGQMPIYAPNFKDSPFGTLLGRPLYISEYAQSMGTSGDIILVNPDGYAFAQHANGVQQMATIGFAFDQGLQSFRAVIRVGGTPLLSAALARKNGSETLSDFVVLS